MALSTHKRYFRRVGVTYSVNLYTSTGDLGSSGGRAVRVGGGTLYEALGATSDGNASYMQVRKNGTTLAILSTMITYVGTWSDNQSVARGTKNLSRTVNYNKLYSTALPYNVVVTVTGDISRCSCIIDGVGVAIGSTTYFRLSTGTHTVSITSETQFASIASAYVPA